jgi:hypothetical protein
MDLRFEQYPQLDLEVRCKGFKKKQDPLIFINSGLKKFTVNNIPKNEKTLMSEY